MHFNWSHLKELRGVLLDGLEEAVALLLVVHDGSTGHPEMAEKAESWLDHWTPNWFSNVLFYGNPWGHFRWWVVAVSNLVIEDKKLHKVEWIQYCKLGEKILAAKAEILLKLKRNLRQVIYQIDLFHHNSIGTKWSSEQMACVVTHSPESKE